MATASHLEEARVPALQLGQIQGGGIAFIRRITQDVRAAARALYVLLEAVLLVCVSLSRSRLRWFSRLLCQEVSPVLRIGIPFSE